MLEANHPGSQEYKANFMNKNNSSEFSIILLVIVIFLGFVGYQTGIPLDALVASISTFAFCVIATIGAFYIGWFPLTIASALSGVFWFVEGRNLMLAKANAVGEGKIHLTFDESAQNLPWYTTDLFLYLIVLVLFAGAYFFYRLEKTHY